MISISKRSVPSYLRSSEFFQVLDDDDDEMMIPSDCFMKVPRVDCAEDLKLLLSTLRYWGVSTIPQLVVKYTVWHKPTAVIDAFAEFHNELRYVKFLEALCKGTAKDYSSSLASDYYYYGIGSPRWSSCEMSCAAEICTIQYVKQNGTTWDATTCKLAAQFGLVDALRFLHEHGCPWNETCCEKAADSGSLICLRYAHEHGCPWDSGTCTAAARSDKLDCLQYAHENGCMLDDKTFASADKNSACRAYLMENGCPRGTASCAAAAEKGDYLVQLKFLHESGCAWDERTCSKAALGGHLAVLKYAHQQGCPWDGQTCTYAAIQKSLACLKYARENGCPWGNTLQYASSTDLFRYAILHDCAKKELACTFAAERGNLEQLLFAREMGCPLTPSICERAAFSGSLPCLTYAHKQGGPWDVQTCNTAAKWGNLSCLRYAHENGCPWDSTTCATASAHGRIECLRYAHEHGCPWDASSCAAAAEKDELPCLQYLHTRGCPWDEETALSAATAGRLHCLKYLYKQRCPWPSARRFQSIEMTARNRSCLEFAAGHPSQPVLPAKSRDAQPEARSETHSSTSAVPTTHSASAPNDVIAAEIIQEIADITMSIQSGAYSVLPVVCHPSTEEELPNGDASAPTKSREVTVKVSPLPTAADEDGWTVVGKRGRVFCSDVPAAVPVALPLNDSSTGSTANAAGVHPVRGGDATVPVAVTASKRAEVSASPQDRALEEQPADEAEEQWTVVTRNKRRAGNAKQLGLKPT